MTTKQAIYAVVGFVWNVVMVVCIVSLLWEMAHLPQTEPVAAIRKGTLAVLLLIQLSTPRKERT